MDYSELVEVYEKIEGTSKRLEKTYRISELLKKSGKDLDSVIFLLQGRVFPAWEKEKLGFSDNSMIKAIQRVTGASETEVKKLWAKKGDLGLVAEELVTDKKQSTLFSRKLSVSKVIENVRKLAAVEGSGSVDRKMQLVSELMSSASPKEAKYIARSVLEVLRVGIATGTLRDGIAWAFLDDLDVEYEPGQNDFTVKDREKYNEQIALVQSAYDKTNDFVEVAALAKKGIKALEAVEISVGKPLKVMLAQRAETIQGGFEKVGKPALLEYKYDGFRMQICKMKSGEVVIYTRRMEDVTKQFPEVAEFVKLVDGKEFILDSEAVGYDPNTKRYTPFQDISQRIRRKYDIEEMAKTLPVEVNVFDILYFEGKSYLKEPMEKRRELLEKIVPHKDFKIRPSEVIKTSDDEEAMEFYEGAKNKGMEGIMMKSLESPYKPGSRVGSMVKLKPTMETLDLVIVGAEWGEGKRSGWLTSYTLACVDDGEYLTIGKVGTGIKELEDAGGVSFQELTDELKPLIISQKGREVVIKPGVLLEIEFNEIQKSPTYSSGYALRFPRVKRIREDRGPEDASTLSMVKQFYEGQ